MLGDHLIKNWATTQTVVAISSACEEARSDRLDGGRWRLTNAVGAWRQASSAAKGIAIW